ncbi:MAG: DUF4159 domain-containing protein [Planctomycetes bacterium]|nr:DUF4159 domain-containing protein [Planctomycetota bacterium]
MRRAASLVLVLCVGAGVLFAAPRARRGKGKAAAPPAKKTFSDAAVAEAIRKGVEFLKSAQKPDGSWGPFGKAGHHFYPVGPTALATYAMLESGLCRYDSPEMKKALDFLAKWQAPSKLTGFKPQRFDQLYKKNWEKYCYKTYSLGLRANAFLAAARQGARQYRINLRKDAAQLIKSTKDGSYNYDSYGLMRSSGDHSNSQYGVLGVWAAAQLDEEVPRQYWYVVLKHWIESMNSDGGWSYRPGQGGSTPTMTTAGLATLFVCYDNLLADGFVKCDQGPRAEAVLKPLNRALAWLDAYYKRAAGQFNSGRGPGGHSYYLLYGVERVGLASGYRYFGKADWYKLGATWLLQHQGPNGSWPGGYGPVVSTSYALLFLVRGRHAVLFNKLDFDGDWNNRPRDLAALCRWISKQFETTVNWQIVNLQVPPEQWLDAPILYISASKAPKFTDAQISALRRYVYMGGTILSCTECDGSGFSKGMRAVYARLFPNYELADCPEDHRLYNINFRLPTSGKDSPQFQVISNGARILAVHTDKDLPKAWQLRRTETDKPAFQAPVNVAMYVTGKALAENALAARGTKSWPKAVDFQPARTVTVARLKYNDTKGKLGNFDPEPMAWERFSRLMAARNRTRVVVKGPMAISELPASGAKVATLVGTDAFSLPAEDVKTLQQFVAGGGLLVLEAVGGSWSGGGARGFSESAQVLARQVADGLPESLAPRKTPRRLTISSPLFQQKGFEIDQVNYRRFSRVELGMKEHTPLLRAVLDNNSRPLILLSNEDLTAGLVGYSSYAINGYTPESAFQIMRNIVLAKAQVVAKPKPAGKAAAKPKQ